MSKIINLPVLQHRGKYDEAEVTNRRALARRGKELGMGIDRPDTLTSVYDLAYLLSAVRGSEPI